MRITEEPLIRRVRSAADWHAVRGLRSASLRAAGDLSLSPVRDFEDAFDGAPNTGTYLLEACGRAVATSRGSVGGPGTAATVPSQGIFAREIEAAFGPAALVVEVSLTFVARAAAIDAQDALLRLFKIHAWRCAAENADALVVAVRDSQIGFYRRRFDMEILSGAERWPGLAKPRVLMGLPWRQHAASLLRRIPTLAASAEDEARFEAL